MFPRCVFVSALAVITAGCLSAARLEGPLPSFVQNGSASALIEITNESGDVVLSGRFASPTVDGRVTSRLATLAGSGPALTGSATMQTVTTKENAVEETLSIDVEGLQHPELYEVLVNNRSVGVFSATISGDVSLHLSRRDAGR